MITPFTTKKKREFLKNSASSKALIAAWTAQLIAVLCVVILLIGTYKVLNMPFYEMPFFEMIFEEEYVANLKQGIFTDDEIDEFSAALDAFGPEDTSEFSEEDMELLYEFRDIVVDLGDNFSISNVNKLTKIYLKIAEIDAFADSDINIALDEDAKYTVDLIEKIVYVVWGVGIFLSLLALLAGYRLSSGFMILLMILNIIPSLAFVGFGQLLLVTGCIIAFFVASGIFKGEFKQFIRSGYERPSYSDESNEKNFLG